jgi:predicted DNA-binding WGR domain protein
MIPEVLLVQSNSNGRVKFIKLICDNDTVHREWGLVGGKTQTTSNTYDYINKGKSNELSPAAAADIDFYRIIEIKKKEGYVVTDSIDNIPNLNNDLMDFENLPVNFCVSKPHTKISRSKFNKLIKNKVARSFIKENGLCHFVLITSNGGIKIYTRRVDDHTSKYGKLVESIKEHNFSPNTLFVGEIIIDPELGMPHMQAFKRVSSISRSDTLKGKVKDDISKTLKLQEETPVKMVVFNVLFAGGEDVTGGTYEQVLDSIKGKLHGDLLEPREAEFETYNEAYEWVKENIDMHEGLVVWNMEENAEITYNGKPNRRACYKLKATREDDVVAYGWEEGSGAKQGKVGSLLIGKYNSEGKIVPLGKVGSGLKIKQGECEIDYWEFPCVIEIEYEQRFPTGSYQFPRFSKKHGEKVPSEVILDQNGM